MVSMIKYPPFIAGWAEDQRGKGGYSEIQVSGLPCGHLQFPLKHTAWAGPQNTRPHNSVSKHTGLSCFPRSFSLPFLLKRPASRMHYPTSLLASSALVQLRILALGMVMVPRWIFKKILLTYIICTKKITYVHWMSLSKLSITLLPYNQHENKKQNISSSLEAPLLPPPPAGVAYTYPRVLTQSAVNCWSLDWNSKSHRCSEYLIKTIKLGSGVDLHWVISGITYRFFCLWRVNDWALNFLGDIYLHSIIRIFFLMCKDMSAWKDIRTSQSQVYFLFSLITSRSLCHLVSSGTFNKPEVTFRGSRFWICVR